MVWAPVMLRGGRASTWVLLESAPSPRTVSGHRSLSVLQGRACPDPPSGCGGAQVCALCSLKHTGLPAGSAALSPRVLLPPRLALPLSLRLPSHFTGHLRANPTSPQVPSQLPPSTRGGHPQEPAHTLLPRARTPGLPHSSQPPALGKPLTPGLQPRLPSLCLPLVRPPSWLLCFSLSTPLCMGSPSPGPRPAHLVTQACASPPFPQLALRFSPQGAEMPAHPGPGGQWKAGSGGPLQSPPLFPPGSFDLFSNLNGTIKDDFSEFDNLRTSKKAGT